MDRRPLRARPQSMVDGDMLCRARWAAFLHNCMRFNKLTLLQLVDRPLHDTIVKSQGLKVRVMLAVCIISLLFLPWGYAAIAPLKTGLGSKSTITFGFVPGILIALLTMGATTVVQLGLTAWCKAHVQDGRFDISPDAYRNIFRAYWWLYKFWQCKVILPYAPTLTYANYNIVPEGALMHAGVFVVGIAVNAVQANLVVFLIVAVATRDPAWLTIACYAILRIILKVMEFLLGPPQTLMALIDDRIAAHPSGSLLEKMSKYESFAVTREELVQLEDELKDNDEKLTPCRVLPGMTHTYSILYKGPCDLRTDDDTDPFKEQWRNLDLSDAYLTLISQPERTAEGTGTRTQEEALADA